MSRILRRPMFRGGGKVSSYGNGIASGLGYAGGGQIGGGAVYGQLMPDGRYGFQKPFIPIGQTKSQIDAGRQAINQMYGIADDFADVGSKSSNVKTQGGNILKRNFKRITDENIVYFTKLMTLFWGLCAIAIACVAYLADNLIQLVNIIGSIFYGNVLGIFLIAFFFKKIKFA